MDNSIFNNEERADLKCSRPFVIGISGACGSGKTWFANKLKEELNGSVCIFTLDIYSKNEQFVKGLEFRYDNPQAIDYDKAYKDFSNLSQGFAVSIPIYDYSFHRVVSEITYRSPSVIIIEGLYAFCDIRFLDAMDCKIWIEADMKTCMERRVKRDIKERGDTSKESMLRHIKDSEPAYQKYYIFYRELADCVYINCKDRAHKSPLLVKILSNYIK